MIRLWLVLLRRELLLSLRHGADSLACLLFFLLAGALFPLALGPAPQLLARIAPGIIWVAAMLATLLPLDRLFAADQDDGSLDQILLTGLPPAAIALAKAAGHWLTTGLPLIVCSPILAASLQMPAAAIPPLLCGLAVGTPTLSLLGTLGAAIVLGARRGGVLLPLLVLPLATPILIFGAAAADSATSRPHLLLLAALLAAAAPLCPLVAASALESD